jgi:hypothetical protein
MVRRRIFTCLLAGSLAATSLVLPACHAPGPHHAGSGCGCRAWQTERLQTQAEAPRGTLPETRGDTVSPTQHQHH